MIFNVLVKPQACLIHRRYMLERLRLAHAPQTSIALRRNFVNKKERTNSKGPETLLTVRQNVTIPNFDIRKKLSEVRRQVASKHDAFKEQHPLAYLILFHLDAVFLICFLVFVNPPLLFGWPSALKADIKASQWALLNGRTKEAVDRASTVWLAIQLLSPDALEPDPNLKVLKVAGLLGSALIKDGQTAEAIRVMSDALSLRRRRMEEERQKAIGKSEPKTAISISKEERECVINLYILLYHLASKLDPKSNGDAKVYLAYAYAESLRLSRAWDVVSGEPLNKSPPLDAEPLIAVSSELGLDSERDIFAGLDGDEICRESPLRRDFLLTQATVKFTGSDGNLISRTATLMGDLCRNLGYHGPAYVFHMNAAQNTGGDVSLCLGRLNKAFVSALNFHRPQTKSPCVTSKVPSAEEIANDCRRMEPLVNELDLRTWEGSPTDQDVYNFYFIYGLACLKIGQRGEASQKLKRALEIARERGFSQKAEEQLKEMDLQLDSSEIIGTTFENGTSSLLLRL